MIATPTFRRRHGRARSVIPMIGPAGNLVVAMLLGFATVGVATAGAQQMQAGARTLSLNEALSIATGASEELRVAGAAVRRAEGDQMRARSQYLPQIYGSFGYTRTLKSQFEGLTGGAPDTGATAGPDTIPKAVCAPFIAPTATQAERQAALDQARSCAGGGNPFDAFSNLPFGQKNQWQVGVSFAQPLFSGGRIVALNTVAKAGRNTAQVALASAKAQLTLDITQSYYDAVLSDRLLAIADSSLVQTETVFRQAQLAKQVGTTSEFELLRASVTRDNQRPAAIQRRTQRDVAYLRLKQLLNLPLNEPLLLTDALDDEDTVAPVRLTGASTPGAGAGAAEVMADTAAKGRATVRQAADLVRIQEGLLRIARSQRMPSVSLTSQYGRVAYPSSGIPSWSDFLTNWTVGVGLQVPIFTGFRIRGDEVVAHANLTEAKARLQQTTEFAALDARVALAALEEAESAWQASLGTAGQASKAYSIADLRYREGISTQIELSESRILMQAAMANRALAARDLAIARVRLAVLRDLPLSPGGQGGVMGGPGSQSGQQQIQQYQQQQQLQQQQASPTQTSGTGGGFQQ